MTHEEIDGVPIWYEEHGDPDGPPLVALHGGILTFERSFSDVLPCLTRGRRVIGVELEGAAQGWQLYAHLGAKALALVGIDAYFVEIVTGEDERGARPA